MLQLSCDPLGWCFRRKLNRLPDPDSYLEGQGHLSSCLFKFEQSVNPHCQHRNVEISHQQSDPLTEWIHHSVSRVTPFGKDENTVAPVHRLPGIGKALAEARFPGKREQIQQ